MIKVDCQQKDIDSWRVKLVFKFEEKFDRSNQYMKFGRNPIKMT